MSGGIENKFLNLFSTTTADAITQIAIFENDRKLLNYVTKLEYSEKDHLLLEIAQKTKNEVVDKLLDFFQWELLRRHMWAKTGGEDGAVVTRSAFSLMIKFTESVDIFEICIGQFEIFLEDNEGELNGVYKELKKELSETCDVKKLFDLWEKASKMRVWLQSKKKTVSTDIKGKIDVKYNEAREKKEEEIKNNNKEEDSKEETKGEEIIDTTKNEIERENEALYDTIKKEMELQEIQDCINALADKTLFLLKMAVPSVWSQEDKNGEYLMLDPISGENEIDMDIKETSIGSRLKSIQRIQSSKGSIHTYEEIDSKEIFNSSGGSILAYLQSSLTVKQIQEKMEERYVSALNRYCGLKMIYKLSCIEANTVIEGNLFNWFCSALRNNKNRIGHYTHGFKGMGEYLRTKTCLEFHKIIANIVAKIKMVKGSSEAMHLLTCCMWEIKATDHEFFLRTGLLDLLLEGNGNSEIKKNPIKYDWERITFERIDSCDLGFSDALYNTIKYFTFSSFGRLLAENKEHVSLSGSQSKRYGSEYPPKSLFYH